MFSWLSVLIPSAATLVASKPWQASPTNDAAPEVKSADQTPLIVVGIIGLAVIIFLIVILNKRK